MRLLVHKTVLHSYRSVHFKLRLFFKLLLLIISMTHLPIFNGHFGFHCPFDLLEIEPFYERHVIVRTAAKKLFVFNLVVSINLVLNFCDDGQRERRIVFADRTGVSSSFPQAEKFAYFFWSFWINWCLCNVGVNVFACFVQSIKKDYYGMLNFNNYHF